MRPRTAVLALAIALAVIASLAITAYVAWTAARRSLAAATTPVEKTIDISTLVTQVRELNRLETFSMHVLHVSTITQSYQLVPNSLGGDELTFLAAGDVIAGLDLSQIKQSDVWREPDGTIAMRLPPAQVLVTRVDNRESRVLSRNTGMFRRADVDLETRARQHAEAMIRAEALRKGVLNQASRNGEQKLADFLHTVGFQKVRFVSETSPAPLR